MNVNLYNTTAYENKSNWTLGENEPNTNPIKANFRKAQMNVNSLITKDYRKKDDFAVKKNKPNSNPISVKPKMNVNLYVIKEYENETGLRTPGKQTQSNPIRVQDFAVRPCSLNALNKLYYIKILFFARFYLPNPCFIFSNIKLLFGILLWRMLTN